MTIQVSQVSVPRQTIARTPPPSIDLTRTNRERLQRTAQAVSEEPRARNPQLPDPRGNAAQAPRSPR